MKTIKILMMALMMCLTSLSFGQSTGDSSHLRINEICQSCIIRSEDSFISDSLITLKTNDYVEFIDVAKYPYIKVRKDNIIGFLSVAYVNNNIHPQFSKEVEKNHLESQKSIRENRERNPDSYFRHVTSDGDVYEIKTWYNGNRYTTKTFINGKLDSESNGYF